MDITILAGYYFPEQSADTRLNKDLAESLADKGYNVTLVVPFPTRNITKEQQDEYLSKRNEIINDNLKIFRIGNPGKYHQGLITRGFEFISKSIKLYSAAKQIETDTYFVISTPPFLGYVAAKLSISCKIPVIYKLQDIFPDSLVHAKNLSEGNPMIKILRKLEKWVYSSVSGIIAISDDMRKTLISRGVDEKKITVIYDWVDDKKCYPIAKENNCLFDELKLSRTDFHVCYAGNIGLLQNIGTIIKAAEIVEQKEPQIQFVIIGDGSWKADMMEMLNTFPHNNVQCFPMQSVEKIAEIYSLGDIGLVSLKPKITEFALPSKTWNILSAGRVAVCEIDLYSCLCEILSKNNCGYCVNPGDAQAMAEKIIGLYNNRSTMIEMSTKGRKYVENSLSRDVAIEQYCTVINKYSKLFRSDLPCSLT